jgi:alcohol oxidase
MAVLKFGYKLTREFARRMPCYEGEYTPNHPVFAEDSDALCKSGIKAVAIDAPRLKYTVEDEKALEDYIRKFGKIETTPF